MISVRREKPGAAPCVWFEGRHAAEGKPSSARVAAKVYGADSE